MLIRSCVRAKAFQFYFSFPKSEVLQDQRFFQEKIFNLLNSVNLLHKQMFLLFGEYYKFLEQKYDTDKKKKTPSDQMSFYSLLLKNSVLKLINQEITENPKQYTLQRNQIFVTWNLHPQIFEQMNKYLKECFTEEEKLEEQDEILIFRHLLQGLALENELVYDIIEEKNIYWSLDFQIVYYLFTEEINKLEKTQIQDNTPYPFINRFAEHTGDVHFVNELITNAIENFELYQEKIIANLTNWDIERISKIDKALVHLAIAEVYTFDEIPITVTLNEYVELAKWFSQPKGFQFINGLLKKVVENSVSLPSKKLK